MKLELAKDPEYQKLIKEMNERVDRAVEKLHKEHGSLRLRKEEQRITEILTQGHLE